MAGRPRRRARRAGQTGSDEAGPGEPGSGEPGSGEAGSGEAGTGAAGSGEPGSGRPGSRRAAGRRGWGRPGPDGPTPGSAAADGPPADPEAAARGICLRLLTHSPRTRAQLADELERRNVPSEVAERVLGRYTEVGLIDDAAFARAWVQTRHAGRGLARRALSAELRRRGVDDDLVRDAVSEVDDEQETRRARALVDRRLPATRGLATVVRVRRLTGMLARKGYPAGVAFAAVRDALAEGGANVADLPDPDVGPDLDGAG